MPLRHNAVSPLRHKHHDSAPLLRSPRRVSVASPAASAHGTCAERSRSQPNALHEFFPDGNPDALDLLNRMLDFDPDSRIVIDQVSNIHT